MPLPKNDPRRKKGHDPADDLPRGTKRGVGYRLPPNARTFRGQPINQDSHPFPAGAKMGEAGQTNLSTEKAAERYPQFDKGFNLKSPDQYLIGLWEARKIPGLSPAEHEEYDGVPTAEEWHDFAMSEDVRVIRAWADVNKSTPFDPKDFDIGDAYEKLSEEEQKAVGELVLLLSRGK